MMKGDQPYLIHIAECIQRIEQYTGDGKGAFLSDIKTQDAVLRNLHTLISPASARAPRWVILAKMATSSPLAATWAQRRRRMTTSRSRTRCKLS